MGPFCILRPVAVPLTPGHLLPKPHLCIVVSIVSRGQCRKSDKLEQPEVAWFENDSQKTALELYFLIVTCELAHNEELI